MIVVGDYTTVIEGIGAYRNTEPNNDGEANKLAVEFAEKLEEKGRTTHAVVRHFS